MGKKTKASLLTLLVSVLNSVLSIVFSLVYSNLVIRTFGSQVNGLISTLTQFVSLFTIIEGGFTTAAVVAVYSPILNHDHKKMNDILYTAKVFFFRVGMIVTLSVLLLGSIYILMIDSPYSYGRTFLLLVLSVSITGSSLCFLSKYSVLLQGNNKEYMQVLFALISRAVTWLLSIIFIIKGFDIVIVFSMNLLNVIINVLLSLLYEKKKFKEVTYRGKNDKSLIKGTGDVFFQKIASTIFTSTDLVLISVFVSLSYASVYNLYFQVFHAVMVMLSAVAQAPFNSFGQLYNEKDGAIKFQEYFDVYQHLVLIISTVIMTITGCLIIPFVKIYSSRITDFNYVYPALAVLFFSQMFSQIINRPYGTALNATGHFKMQNIQCALAAVINIIVSLAFINLLGIHSIVLGSFIGTLIILIMNVYQAYGKVLQVSAKRIVANICINYVFSLVVIFCSIKLALAPSSFLSLFGLAIIFGLFITAFVLILNLIIDKKRTVNALVYLRTIVKKNRSSN